MELESHGYSGEYMDWMRVKEGWMSKWSLLHLYLKRILNHDNSIMIIKMLINELEYHRGIPTCFLFAPPCVSRQNKLTPFISIRSSEIALTSNRIWQRSSIFKTQIRYMASERGIRKSNLSVYASVCKIKNIQKENISIKDKVEDLKTIMPHVLPHIVDYL